MFTESQRLSHNLILFRYWFSFVSCKHQGSFLLHYLFCQSAQMHVHKARVAEPTGCSLAGDGFLAHRQALFNLSVF
ncbi:hypothetical protein DUNSADRAFT_7611 [Dunaliella salina]|uniref:Encoded protein n=1 Tax=Dunaliella salina TaxID=3046 RepID=A0ABQ7GL10_DUNSA|nr:hypothetical protein DUNSADRAFT_7611 [Dunaliella salina]|eukprot:KAF5835286.1 hypothetical protein DUNSADRAFT_7611 [Dunaliella salina]